MTYKARKWQLNIDSRANDGKVVTVRCDDKVLGILSVDGWELGQLKEIFHKGCAQVDEATLSIADWSDMRYGPGGLGDD